MDFKRKKYIEELERLRAGTYRRMRKGLYLDRNERVVPFDKSVIDHLHKHLKTIPLNLYPDVEEFYESLARWLKVKREEIYVTEGVSGAVKAIIETISMPGDNIVFPTPTFAMYPVYCRMFNLEYRTVGYNDDYTLDIERLKGSIDDRTSIVFLPNPNVPIEGTLSLGKIASLARYCKAKGVFLVLDEVYYPFGGPTGLSLIPRFDNLLIMRSFSKAFGLAGIRVGYTIGDKRNIDYISKTRTGYETNVLSMACASFFMNNYHLVERYIKSVKRGFSFLKKELDNLGLEHNGGSTSNFMYINMRDKEKADGVVTRLERKNIFVRGGWPKPFDGGISLTGGPKDIMGIFIKEFSSILTDLKYKKR